MAEEKILTINLRKDLKNSPRWQNSKNASAVLKKKLERAVKSEVKIDGKISEKIWSRGRSSPATKLRIKMTKTGDAYKAELV